MSVQNSNSKISARPELANSNPHEYQLHLTGYCVKEGYLHYSYVLEDGKNVRKIIHCDFCLSKK